MKRIILFCVLFLFTVFNLSGVGAQETHPEKNNETKLSFETVKIGQLPEGWKVEATHPKGPLATWKVIQDPSAPSGKKVLALTKINHVFGGTFNLCWTNKTQFLNGVIEVKFKANTGRGDQGGGVIWRTQNKDNYYVARYNPLENNFRIYYVKNGARRMLASARIKLPAHKWYEMKIVQSGVNISGYLNDRKLLNVKDKTFRNAGGVGLWTKADAATSFDDFEVESLHSEKAEQKDHD